MLLESSEASISSLPITGEVEAGPQSVSPRVILTPLDLELDALEAEAEISSLGKQGLEADSTLIRRALGFPF